MRGNYGPRASRGFRGLWNGRGRQELKVTDTATVNVNVPTLGAVSLINGTAAGTDYTQRIGRKMTNKSLLIRLQLAPVTTSNIVGDLVRFMVFYDSQTNGALPAVTDVLVAADPMSPMNLNNRDRFKVIKDFLIGMEATEYAANVLTVGSPRTHIVKAYKKCSLVTVFSGTAATIGSIASGSICVLYVSQYNNLTTIYYNIRTRFHDE